MKKVLKVLAIVLCLVLAVSCFAACGGDKEPTPSTPAETESKLTTGGLFTFSFDNAGTSYGYYFHFYDNGIFYYSLMNGSSKCIGRYEVVDGYEVEYCVDRAAKTADPKQISKITPAKCVEFYDVAGTKIGQAGYDSDKLYGVVISGVATYGLEVVYTQDAAYVPDSKSAELGVAIATYGDPNDASCYVQINHNGTFIDMMTSYIEGTWTYDGTTYTMTDGTDTMTLTVNGAKAEYKGADGSTMTLDAVVEEEDGGSQGGASGSFKGTHPSRGDVTITPSADYSTAVVNCYFMTDWEITCKISIAADGTCTLGDFVSGGDKADQIWGMFKGSVWKFSSDGTMECVSAG